MTDPVATIDLRSLDLSQGTETRLDLHVPPVELRLGGQDYVTEPAEPAAEVRIAHSLSGLHVRLRSGADLVGPCWRCMGPARVPIAVDAREFSAEGRTAEDPFDEDLDSVYLSPTALDLALWSRDSFAEAVPAVILCREDCAGLCPTCGVDRNLVSCGCTPVEVDSRWDALKAIAERLESGER